MKFETILISVLLGTIIMVTGMTLIESQLDHYDVDYNRGAYENMSDHLDNVYDEIKKTKQDVEAPEVGEEESWEDLVKKSYEAVKKLPQQLGVVGDVLRLLSNELGINPVFVNGLMIALLAVVSFGIIYMVFRFQPR